MKKVFFYLIEDYFFDMTERAIRGKDCQNYQMKNLEYKVLSLLVQKEGVILSKDFIVEAVWGLKSDKHTDQCLANVVSNLRRRFPFLRCLITTHKGVGYKFNREKDFLGSSMILLTQ